MKLIAFAQCCVPDVAAARRLYDVDGLDDKAVAKILFHRRKQQTGGEILRPDQQRPALVTLVHGEPENPRMTSLSVAEKDETEILQRIGDILGGTGHLNGWQLADDLAILRLRAIHLGTAVPRLFVDEHQELAAAWGGVTPLDEAALLMGLPGLSGSDVLDNWAAWQAGDHTALQARAELQALNCWLLAQRLAVAQGRLTPSAARSGIQALRNLLADVSADHLQRFVAALEG